MAEHQVSDTEKTSEGDKIEGDTHLNYLMYYKTKGWLTEVNSFDCPIKKLRKIIGIIVRLLFLLFVSLKFRWGKIDILVNA